MLPAVAAIVVRTPQPSEWPVCRALIPEAFQESPAPDALVALDRERGAPLGCATFQWTADAVFLRVRVIRGRRRQGCGASLVRRLAQVAAERRVSEIHARVNPIAEPDAAPFLSACGFVLKSRVLTVEAPDEPLFSHVFRLRARLLAGGRLPAGVRIASLGEVPREPLARLYTTLVVPELRLPPGAAAPLVWDPRFAESPVLLVDGAAAGMLLIEANDGNGVGIVVARVVAPEYQRGGWANLLLMAEGCERGKRKGATRIRFEAPEDNPDTVKLMARAKAQVTRGAAWYIRPVTYDGER